MGRGVLVAQGNHSLPNSSVSRIYHMHVMLERIQNILLTCVPELFFSLASLFSKLLSRKRLPAKSCFLHNCRGDKLLKMNIGQSGLT